MKNKEQIYNFSESSKNRMQMFEEPDAARKPQFGQSLHLYIIVSSEDENCGLDFWYFIIFDLAANTNLKNTCKYHVFFKYCKIQYFMFLWHTLTN